MPIDIPGFYGGSFIFEGALPAKTFPAGRLFRLQAPEGGLGLQTSLCFISDTNSGKKIIITSSSSRLR